MSRKSTVGSLVLVFSLAMFFVVGSFAAPRVTPLPAVQPDPQSADCSTMSDDDIVKAVIENIKKRFNPEEVSSQLHLTITSKNGVVEIQGDAHGINPKNPREVRTRVTSIAKKTPCVKKVVTKHFSEVHNPACDPGKKPCNGGCVNQDAPCNRMAEPRG